MAKINNNTVADWHDGDTMHAPDYTKERTILITAINDTDTRVDALAGADGVDTVQIKDGAVTNPKIAAGAVTNDKIASGVDGAKISDDTLTGAKIKDNSIIGRHVANRTITESKIQEGALDGRYYTEPEVDGLLQQNRSGNHEGTWQGLTPPAIGAGDMNGARITRLEDDIWNDTDTAVTLVNGQQTVDVLQDTFLNVLSLKGATQYPTQVGAVDSPKNIVNPYVNTPTSRLTLTTELMSDINGTVADTVVNNNGVYQKTSYFNKTALDNSLSWFYGESRTGLKIIYAPTPNQAITATEYVNKYDGKLLKRGVYLDLIAAPDVSFIDGVSNINLSVANTDSGWGEQSNSNTFSGNSVQATFVLTPHAGVEIIPSSVTAKVNNVDTPIKTVSGNNVTFNTAPGMGVSNIIISYTEAYTPSVDEVKAYIYGWKLYDSATITDSSTYVSGIKKWARKSSGGSWVDGTTTLPTSSYTGYTPYQIQYQRKTAITEIVPYEGVLTLRKGLNTVVCGHAGTVPLPTISGSIPNTRGVLNDLIEQSSYGAPYVNVRRFGAKGDGVADDTLAIQSAIDFLPNGGNIFFPAGQYKITQTIKLKNNLQLSGVNSSVAGTKGTNILFYGNNCNAIELIAETSRENIKLLNLAVINMSASPLDGIHLERFTTQCSIENVSIRGFKNNLVILRSWYSLLSNIDSSYAIEEGIILSRTNGVALTNIRSRNCGFSGLLLTNDCDNLAVIGGAFESNTYGIKVFDCKAINISTYFEANKTNDVFLSANSGGAGRSINIKNSFFNPMTSVNNTTQQNSINVEAAEVVHINGNYFAERLAASIRVGSASKDVYIENNYYVDSTKVLNDLGVRTRLNEPLVRMDILLGKLMDNLDANFKSIVNLSEARGRSDKPLDIIGNGQNIRLNYSNLKNTDVYYGTGKVAGFDSSDLRFEVQGKGVIVKDKATGNLYRVIVNNGVLAVEATS